MMSCHHLDIKAPEVTEQGKMGPKLKMVTPNHIKHKPIGGNASPKNLKSMLTWKAADADDEEGEEIEDSGTSGVPTPTPPF